MEKLGIHIESLSVSLKVEAVYLNLREHPLLNLLRVNDFYCLHGTLSREPPLYTGPVPDTDNNPSKVEGEMPSSHIPGHYSSGVSCPRDIEM
ncbi:hypothetical protein Peur_068517 [Populus x canadensis]